MTNHKKKVLESKICSVKINCMKNATNKADTDTHARSEMELCLNQLINDINNTP